MSIRVFLYGQSDHTAALRQLIEKSGELTAVGETEQENKVLDAITAMNADVLMLYLDGGAANYRVAEQVYMLRPQCLCFALSSRRMGDKENGDAFRSGIHYIYPDTLTEEELFAYVKNAYTIEQNRKTALNGKTAGMTAAKVLTFYSPKNGVGQTTFLTGLAMHLTRERKKVIILDFDLQFGDVNTVTGIETKETLAELLQEQSSPTIDIVRRYIVYHKGGTSILCAPRNAEYAERIRSEQLEKIITALRPYYDYILIDTAPNFNDASFTCFEHSDSVLFLLRADISSLKHTKKIISLLESLGQDGKIRLLLSDVGKSSRIDKSAVEKTLGRTVWHLVPWDFKNAVEAMNQGEPIVNLFPKSSVSKACVAAAEKLLKEERDENTEKAKRSSGLFARKARKA